jgi:hypothetical protein
MTSLTGETAVGELLSVPRRLLEYGPTRPMTDTLLYPVHDTSTQTARAYGCVRRPSLQSRPDLGGRRPARGGYRPRFLGQTTPSATRKYTDRLRRRENADALASKLVPLEVPQVKTNEGECVMRRNFSARGEIRTRMGLPPVDFESTASAVPPLGPSK